MSKKRHYATVAEANEAREKLRPQLGSVMMAIVTREVFPLVSDADGSSIGAQIDNLLFEAAKEHKEVSEITLNLFAEQAGAVGAYYRGEPA